MKDVQQNKAWKPVTLKTAVLPAVGGQHSAVSGMWCAVQLYNDIVTVFVPPVLQA